MIPGNSLCYEEMLKESRLIERRNLFSSQMAKEEGVLISINSDAHSVYDFANLRFGIGQAWHGWLEKHDVLNARSLKELRLLINLMMSLLR